MVHTSHARQTRLIEWSAWHRLLSIDLGQWRQACRTEFADALDGRARAYGFSPSKGDQGPS